MDMEIRKFPLKYHRRHRLPRQTSTATNYRRRQKGRLPITHGKEPDNKNLLDHERSHHRLFVPIKAPPVFTLLFKGRRPTESASPRTIIIRGSSLLHNRISSIIFLLSITWMMGKCSSMFLYSWGRRPASFFSDNVIISSGVRRRL